MKRIFRWVDRGRAPNAVEGDYWKRAFRDSGRNVIVEHKRKRKEKREAENEVSKKGVMP